MNKSIYLIPVLMLLMLPSILWAQGTIQVQSRAEMEVTKTNDRGEEVTVLIPAEKVLPGEVVVYTNTITNAGEESAEAVTINNPVPEHTNYLAGSAFGDATILFSADNGRNFAPEGEVEAIGADGKPRLAQPNEYTHIRWRLLNELTAGESSEVGFRVRLQ